MVERYKYDAYGQVTFMDGNSTPLPGESSPDVQNNILFTGRYYDTESDTYYYRARNYHPYLGRFLQRDPLGESASLNLYSYVFDNPINSVDPTGMATGLMRDMMNLEAFGSKDAPTGHWIYGVSGAEPSERSKRLTEWRWNYMLCPSCRSRTASSLSALEEAMKEDAEKLSAANGNKPFILVLDLYRIAGTWKDQKNGQANADIQKMFSIASEIYGEYDITVTDGYLIEDPSKITVDVLDSKPSHGEASFDFMKENLPEGGPDLNRISVLYASEMANIEGCDKFSAGCSWVDQRMTIIPWMNAAGISRDYVGQTSWTGYVTILAHEVGHFFGLKEFKGGNADSPYVANLMFQNSSWRKGYRIPDFGLLQLGSLVVSSGH